VGQLFNRWLGSWLVFKGSMSLFAPYFWPQWLDTAFHHPQSTRLTMHQVTMACHKAGKSPGQRARFGFAPGCGLT
jgi:hypothetical protein